MNFLSKKEKKISDNFLKKGYLINAADNKKSLNYLFSTFSKEISKILKKKIIDLNYIHNYISINNLNEFRMELHHNVNKDKDIRFHYFRIGQNSLYNIVGNELMMQNKLNLSIQFPDDSSSLLPILSISFRAFWHSFNLKLWSVVFEKTKSKWFSLNLKFFLAS